MPPDREVNKPSSDMATFAKIDGYLYITPVTSVPSFIFVVIATSIDITVQPSICGLFWSSHKLNLVKMIHYPK
jgi:hypothetical protein